MKCVAVQQQAALGHSSLRARLPASRPCRLVLTRSNGNGASAVVCALQAGARVKVSESITIFHVGKYKSGLNLQGMEGVVVSDETQYKGLTLSANLPWKVQFMVPAPDGGKDIKVLAHLAEEELQVLE